MPFCPQLNTRECLWVHFPINETLTFIFGTPRGTSRFLPTMGFGFVGVFQFPCRLWLDGPAPEPIRGRMVIGLIKQIRRPLDLSCFGCSHRSAVGSQSMMRSCQLI